MVTAQSIRIGSRVVADGAPIYFIAEAGVNHNGDINLAHQLVDVAADCGADAVKFQTFTAEAIATRRAPKAEYHVQTTGAEQSWFDLLKSQELDRSMHEELIAHCAERSITFLSTPYDTASADLLGELQVPAFKVASTDANNIPFLKHLASKGRPILFSTAMCTMDEVRASVTAIRAAGCDDLIVFHCTGSYPAPLLSTNMRVLSALRNELQTLVGYSDHTVEDVNPILAVACGAVAYEKHFTLDRSLPGPDHRASLDPAALAETIRRIRDAEGAMGIAEKSVQECERANRPLLRKSLVAAKDIRRGDVIAADAVALKRPGTGLEPVRIDEVLGRRARVDIVEDTLLTLEQFEQR